MKRKPAQGESMAYKGYGDQSAAQSKAIASYQPALASYTGTGDVTTSPFYKSLVNLGTQATGRAYENAAAGTRLRSNVSGFGYASPTSQGADREMAAERAGAMSKVRPEAALEATGPQLEAIGLGERSASLYNPLGYLQTGSSAEQEALNRRNALYRSLIGAGGNIAGAFASNRSG